MNEEEKKETAITQQKEDFDVFKRFDELDDSIILSELEHKVTDVWIYHFRVRGKDIYGMAKPGVDECVSRMAKKGIMLRDESLDWRQDPWKPEYMCFTAKVSRVIVTKDGHEVIADAAIGTKRQWVFFKDSRTKQILPNPFWFEQGSMKALRNARLRLIPEEIKTRVIEFAKTKKKRIERVNDSKVEKKKPVETPKEKSAEFAPEPQSMGSAPEPQSNFGFVPEVETTAVKEDMKPSQEQMMNIVRLQATLVDKYHFTPGQIIEEMERRFKQSDVNKLTPDEADGVIDFFGQTIEHNIKNLKK